MSEFFTKHKSIIYAVMVAIIVILIIYYMGKSAGKDTPPRAVVLPNDKNPLPNFNPGPYTDAVYSDVYGGILKPRDIKPYQDLNNLSDSALAAVYNDWNNRYFSKDHETLTQALEGEWLAFFSTDFRTMRDAIVSRLRKIVTNG